MEHIPQFTDLGGFIVGDKVKAGLLGQYPSLAPAGLLQGDLESAVDFHSVYAGVLEGWALRQKSQLLS